MMVMGPHRSKAPSVTATFPLLRCQWRRKDVGETKQSRGRGWQERRVCGGVDMTDTWPSCPPQTGYQIAYRLASSSPNTFTTVEVGATVRQFTATELAPESAYIFRLSAKTRQGWGEPLEATVITTEKRGKTQGPRPPSGGSGEESWAQTGVTILLGHGFPGQALHRSVSTQPDIYRTGRNVPLCSQRGCITGPERV